MRKVPVLLFAAVLALLIVFTFMPTGVSADAVVSGYASTLSYYGNGIFEVVSPDMIAADPLLLAAEKTIGESCGYIWVDEDGLPVTNYVKTSTFPARGGDENSTSDNTVIDYERYADSDVAPVHRGTDFALNYTPDVKPYQVTLWGGTVVDASFISGYGYQVIVAHGNHIYTRYAHLDSLLVEAGDVVAKGDVVGVLGATGGDYADHAHIELFLCPNGYIATTGEYMATYFYAGVDNLLRGDATLSKLTWYQISAGKDSIDNALDGEVVLSG